MARDTSAETPQNVVDTPLNPFESAFGLLKALRSELQDLKAEVGELRANIRERIDGVDAGINGFRASAYLRFNELQNQIDSLKRPKDKRLEDTAKILAEDLRGDKKAKLDTLEAEIRKEVSERLTVDISLDKKIMAKFRELQVQCDKHDRNHQEHKEKVEAAHAVERKKHDVLRNDLEKLAALLSCNTLSRDPFNELGYKHTPPAATSTELGSTALSSLPPLFGSSPLRGGTSSS